MRAPETNSSEITSLKSIFYRRMAADAVELIRRGRDDAEPVTRLPARGTCDHNDAPLAFNCLLRGCDAFARSSKSRCTKSDRHSDRRASNRPTAQAIWLSHSCHTGRLSLFNSKSKIKRGDAGRHSCRRKCSRRSRSRRCFASSERVPPAATSFS